MVSDEQLKGVASFVQVVEAGSFALAAQRQGQTRSALSKAIARLEQRLGTRLFHRSTRRQVLTPGGEAYYEHCRRALAEIEAAGAVLQQADRELTGRLRMGLPLLLGRSLVAPLLTRLALRHPGLELSLAFSDRVVDLWDEGIDLALRLGPLTDSAQLAARPLGRFDFVLCAAPAYLKRQGLPRRLEDFASHVAFVYGDPVRAENPWRLRDPEGGDGREGREQLLPLGRRIWLDDVQAIADAALDGLGLARLPRWLAAPHLAAGRLQALWEGASEQTVEAHLVWPHRRLLPHKTRVVIDTLAEALPPLLNP